MSFNRGPSQESIEFTGEMPEEYEDEEYYGDEEAYAEDEGVEDYEEEEYEEEEEGSPGSAAPKKDWVRTAIYAVAGLIVASGVTYWAASLLMPGAMNDIVNNLPFVSKGADKSADVPNGDVPPPGTEGAPGTKPADVTSGGEVPAVPPDPAAATAMKPDVPGGAPPVVPTSDLKPATMPKPGTAPAGQPKANPMGAPMEGMPMEGVPPGQPMATPTKPHHKGTAKGHAKPSTWRARLAAKQRIAHAPGYRRYLSQPAPVYYQAPASFGPYAVQVGSFANAGRAVALVSQLRSQGIPAYMSGGAAGSRGGYSVRSIPVSTRAGARRLLARYRAAGYRGQLVPVGNGKLAVHVGHFASAQQARNVVWELSSQGFTAGMHRRVAGAAGGRMARVYIGSYASRQAAASKAYQLQALGIPAAVTSN